MSKETRARKLAKNIASYIFEEEYDELQSVSSKDIEILRSAISVLIKIPNKK